jgi:glycosyltransferase involved in cell wall biosynthesis
MIGRILLHLSNSFSNDQVIGGAELGMLTIMKELRGGGFEPHVVMHGGGYFESLLKESAIPYEIIPLASNASAISRNRRVAFADLPAAATQVLRTAHKISKFARSWKIDVIHANHLSGYLSCSLAAKRNRIPNIWHLHEGLAAGLVSQVLQRSASVLTNHVITMAPYEASTIEYMTRHVEHTMIEGAFAFDELLASRKRSDIEIRAELGIDPEDVLVAYVSHLAPYKGQGTFLESFSRLPQNAGYRAVLVGGPRKSYEWFPKQLRADVKSLGLEARVQLCGYRADVPDIMNAADIVVCVSQ